MTSVPPPIDPGLTTEEARARLAKHGPNALPEPKPTPVWRRVAAQFASPLVLLLVGALVFDLIIWVRSGAADVPVEGIAIGAILVLNAVLGVLQEQRSEAALAQLRALAAPQAWVMRDKKLVRVPGSEIVPGDVVRVEAGERVPADGVLLESLGLLIDESVLTGESVPVDKSKEERVSSSTLVSRGRGMFRVDATGEQSSMGKLAAMLGSISQERTPLEKRLDALGTRVAQVVFGLALVLAVMGIAAEGISHAERVILFAVALAVAAVPEGMPAVVTLTLALGVQRMAKRNAVVRRLAAVEALGSVTVVCTDKTGTLTENRMRVHALEAEAGREEDAMLALVLANDADGAAGDPLELGLLAHAESNGLDVAETRGRHRRLTSRPFDSEWKYMRVTVESQTHGPRSFLKGAPEVLLARCRMDDATRDARNARAEEAASDGHRVLAVAAGKGEAETDLEFLGFVLLWDPPRKEVPGAIALAQAAGVRVVMITGDHPATAKAIARTVGMARTEVRTGADLEGLTPEQMRVVAREASVFARVSPEHKLRLVEALQAEGEIVAMSGDGVNDAPALKRADVGVAMGQRGSDVAREVADLVLLDDDFATIVGAIEEGRSIFENLATFVRFTFATNVALVLLVVTGAIGAYVQDVRDAAGHILVPLTALQLLWINFLGDGPPALALALDRSPGVMQRPPRPAKTGLLDKPAVRFIAISGLVRGALGVGLLIAAPVLGATIAMTQTLVFLLESVGKLVSVYPARRVANRPHTNWALHGSIAFGIGLQVIALAVPAVRELLHLEMPTPQMLGVVAGLIAVTWMAEELIARLAAPRPARV